jgi:hypothetical protein
MDGEFMLWLALSVLWCRISLWFGANTSTGMLWWNALRYGLRHHWRSSHYATIHVVSLISPFYRIFLEFSSTGCEIC